MDMHPTASLAKLAHRFVPQFGNPVGSAHGWTSISGVDWLYVAALRKCNREIIYYDASSGGDVMAYIGVDCILRDR
jgi:hypothetical protein